MVSDLGLYNVTNINMGLKWYLSSSDPAVIGLKIMWVLPDAFELQLIADKITFKQLIK